MLKAFQIHPDSTREFPAFLHIFQALAGRKALEFGSHSLDVNEMFEYESTDSSSENAPKKSERLEPEFSPSIFGFHLSWAVDVLIFQQNFKPQPLMVINDLRGIRRSVNQCLYGINLGC